VSSSAALGGRPELVADFGDERIVIGLPTLVCKLICDQSNPRIAARRGRNC
jgi:hypothetical protein